MIQNVIPAHTSSHDVLRYNGTFDEKLKIASLRILKCFVECATEGFFMHLHSVQQWLTGQTTWGVADSGSDVRTLRRLNKLYDRLSVIGEITVAFLLVGLVCSCAWLLTQTSFEDVIFWDSTDHICVLDSRTGEIRYATGN